MEITTIIISLLALIVSIGAFWLSIVAFKRSKYVERPSLVTAHFGGGDRFVCVLNDYSSSKNLRVDKVEVKPLGKKDYLSVNYETRYNDSVKPPQLVITSLDTFAPLDGYKFKIHTNYGLIQEHFPGLFSEE